jgi:hypothetical protein
MLHYTGIAQDYLEENKSLTPYGRRGLISRPLSSSNAFYTSLRWHRSGSSSGERERHLPQDALFDLMAAVQPRVLAPFSALA